MIWERNRTNETKEMQRKPNSPQIPWTMVLFRLIIALLVKRFSFRTINCWSSVEHASYISHKPHSHLFFSSSLNAHQLHIAFDFVIIYSIFITWKLWMDFQSYWILLHWFWIVISNNFCGNQQESFIIEHIYNACIQIVT